MTDTQKESLQNDIERLIAKKYGKKVKINWDITESIMKITLSAEFNRS